MGMECAVDSDMEIHGVTHARWVGAPPPIYCGNRRVGYWDHITGLEEHEPLFKNERGWSDIKGCCWWGRGGEFFLILILITCARLFLSLTTCL